jgi:hypothetical protein
MSSCCYPGSRRPPLGRVIYATWPGPQWTPWNVMTSLAALPTAPGHARAYVRAAVHAWGISSLAEVAELVATELVTNAVCASEGPDLHPSNQDDQTPAIGLCLLLTDGARLRIEVWDQAAGFPLLYEASADSDSGRGLALVDAMTEGHWGWHPAAISNAAKCVWAEIDHPAPVAAAIPMTPALAHPSQETGGRNMTTTGTELAPPLATSLNAATADPPDPGLRTIPLEDHATSATGDAARPRELIAPGLFSELTYRVATVDGHDQDTAERIVEQALTFLVACARYPDGHLSPSETVDAGWHAFILHTADYAEFCERVAGRFIHHRPGNPSGVASGQQTIGVTIAAIRDAGLHVDPDLWVPRAECSQCYQGCADDPKGA